MELYGVIYKCELCGELIQFGDAFESNHEKIKMLTEQVIKNQRFAGNPYLHKAPMYLTHNCKNGSCGVANFAGIVPFVKTK